MTGRARRREGPTGGLAGPRAQKTVSLALQGGGSHGAFTWGVLDALLEDGRLAIEAISGASAGAMNAVGWSWRGGSGAGSMGAKPARNLLAPSQPRRVPFPRPARASRPDAGLLEQGLDDDRATLQSLPDEPAQHQSFADAIDALIDFDRVRACNDVALFVSATNVWTGKIANLQDRGVTADHLMASACLPTVFQAVEINGVPYWTAAIWASSGPVPALR